MYQYSASGTIFIDFDGPGYDMNESKRLIIVGHGGQTDRFARLYQDEGWADIRVLDPSKCSTVGPHLPCDFVHITGPVTATPADLLEQALHHGFSLGVSWPEQHCWADYERFVVECEQHNVKVMLIHPPLYMTCFIRMLHHIQTGIIGKASQVTIKVPAMQPGDILVDLPGPLRDSLALCAKLLDEQIRWNEVGAEPAAPLKLSGSAGDCAVELLFSATDSETVIAVQGAAGTLQLVRQGLDWALLARRNGHCRTLMEPASHDPMQDAVRSVIRFATDGTGTMAKGHTGLLAMKSISEARRHLESANTPLKEQQTRTATKPKEDEFLEMEVFQKVPMTGAVRGKPPEIAVAETKLDVADECNQNCLFCFGRGNRLIPSTLEEYRAIFGYLKQQGIDGIVLSGGEPTLEPRLPQIVSEAKRAGLDHVTLETNATLCEDPALVDRLVEAGVDSAFVSLHSSNPETVDRLTGVPRSLPRTIAGIANMCARDIEVHLNCVVNSHNFSELEQLVLFVGRHVRDAKSMTFSFVAPLGRAAKNPELVPRIEDTVPYLRKALMAGEELGMVVMVPPRCGIPQCYLPQMERFFVEHQMRHLGAMFHLPTCDRIKSENCNMCTKDHYCQGLWAGYARLYGTDHLRPLVPLAHSKEEGRLK